MKNWTRYLPTNANKHQVSLTAGEKEYKFLSIDHVKGNGNAHRRKIGGWGSSFYSWIVRNNYPKSLQILCYNCNLAKGFYGKCPHKEK